VNLKIKKQKIIKAYKLADNDTYLFEKIGKNKFRFLENKKKLNTILNNHIYNYIAIILILLIFKFIPWEYEELFKESISSFSLFVITAIIVFFILGIYLILFVEFIRKSRSMISVLYLKTLKNKKEFKRLPKFILNGFVKANNVYIYKLKNKSGSIQIVTKNKISFKNFKSLKKSLLKTKTSHSVLISKKRILIYFDTNESLCRVKKANEYIIDNKLKNLKKVNYDYFLIKK